MSKELEFLETIMTTKELKPLLEQVKQALKRLEAIDNANPSEALRELNIIRHLEIGFDKNGNSITLNDIEGLNIIKQALLKAQEQEELLKTGDLSDGYHTFNQLYYQRCILFASLVRLNKDKSWKSFKHNDGKYCFDSNGEWFIVGIDTPIGSYTYHYEKKYWDLFECQELECGKKWDGHTEEDVTRLLSLPNEQEKVIIELCEYCGMDNLYPYNNLEEIEITFKETFDNYQRQRIESLGRLNKQEKELKEVKANLTIELNNKKNAIEMFKQERTLRENQEKVLEILFKKQVDLGWLWYCIHECVNSLNEYNKKMPIEKFKLTKEEFELLKRWIECLKN